MPGLLFRVIKASEWKVRIAHIWINVKLNKQRVDPEEHEKEEALTCVKYKKTDSLVFECFFLVVRGW